MADTLNPVTLITGAASAIGIATACALAPMATGGLILIDRDEDRLAAVADSLPVAPERVSTLAFNCSDQKWWRKASEFIEGQYGRLDWALVHAGTTPAGENDFRSVSGLNMEAAVLSLRAIIALMQRNRGGGGVVLTGALAGAPSFVNSKPGLLQVLNVAAKEGARSGVRVNALTPGADIALLRNAPVFEDLVRQFGNPRAAFARVGELRLPLARTGADDVAGLVVQLLTQSEPLTGATLVADGGYTL